MKLILIISAILFYLTSTSQYQIHHYLDGSDDEKAADFFEYNGNYTVLASTRSHHLNTENITLIHTKGYLNEFYQLFPSNNYAYPTKIIKTDDGYLISAIKFYYDKRQDATLIKLDENLEMIWEKSKVE